MVTSRYPYGGADQAAMLLVQGLEARHEVFFLATGKTDEESDEDGHRRIVIGLPCVRWFWHHYWNRSVVRKLRQHLARIKPDVVHFHSIANRTFSAAALLVSKDYPTFWTLHDVWSQCIWSIARPSTCEGMLWGCRWCGAMPVLSMVNRRLKEFIYRRADIEVIVPSTWLGDRVAKSALARKPVHVIPNGVPFERFQTGDGDRVRRKFGIPQTGRVVLFAGQMMNNWKGHDDLLEIASRVLADEKDVWFMFVGPHCGLTAAHAQIVYAGAVTYEEMSDYYAAGDIFAYPTHADVFPQVVLEAMASALPVVAHRIGAVPEQVRDDCTGIIVDEGDAARFERGLRLLLKDTQLRRSMGKKGRQRISRLFTTKMQLGRTEELYRRAIPGTPTIKKGSGHLFL